MVLVSAQGYVASIVGFFDMMGNIGGTGEYTHSCCLAGTIPRF